MEQEQGSEPEVGAKQTQITNKTQIRTTNTARPSTHENQELENRKQESGQKSGPVEGAMACTFTRKGMCKLHKVLGTGTLVTSKVWQDRGKGRGYGYVVRKVTKYRCSVRNITPEVSDIYPETRAWLHIANKERESEEGN